MRKLIKKFSNWHKSRSIPSEKNKLITADSYKYTQNEVVTQQKFSFSSPSEPKKPNRNVMAIHFDDSDPDSSNRQTMGVSDYMVAFSRLSKSYCVGIVDMVGSTKISASMNEICWSKYYGIFLNHMAKILPRFGGVVIKNQGDSLLYYFPESVNATNLDFMSCLECALAMLEEHNSVSGMLRKEGLPPLDYRISADYGKVVLMKSNNSSCYDLIGPQVNMCGKINHAAPPNGAVIGGDLYSMVRGLDKYKFEEIKGFSLGYNHSYPVFSLSRKK